MQEEVTKKVQDKHQSIDTFISRNVEENQRRIEQEEMEKMRRKLELQKAVSESHKVKIIEKEREREVYKQGYWEKAEQVIKDSNDLQKQSWDQKRFKMEKQREYQEFLAGQVKNKEDNMMKGILYMGEEEKKLLNANSSFSGLKNPGMNYSPTIVGKQPTHQLNQSLTYDNRQSGGDNRYLSQEPERKLSGYNPITNAIPNHNQNPYMQGKLSPKPQRKNFFASVANSNMISSSVM